MTDSAGPFPRVVQVASGRQWRGGERQVWLLAKAARSLGIDQLVVTDRSGRLAHQLVRDEIPVRGVEWGIGLSPRALLALVSEGRRDPTTLFHAHDPHSVTLSGLASAITGRHFVVTRRVDLPLRRLGLWPRARAIIAVSEAVRQSLIASGIAPSKIIVIHSGVETAPGSDAEPPRPGTLITVGALTPEKGHAFLVDVAARLAPAHPGLVWTFAGAGPLRSELESLITSKHLDGIIRFAGDVDDPRPLIRTATVFVSGATSEGLGTAILDAMACRVPVVAISAGGVPEMLGGGAGVLIDRGNAERMATEIDRLLRNEAARRDVLEKASARVARFSVERMATEVASVYRSVAQSR